MGILNSLSNGRFALELKKITHDYWKLKNWREEDNKVFLESILQRGYQQSKEAAEE